MDALLKILIVFAVMLGLMRLKVPMGLALLAGGIALCLWAGRGWATTLADVFTAFQAAELWLLLLVTILIFELGRYMAEERNANVIMGWARSWGGRHGRAASLMAIPSVIGLVPMPGGALFSAPLVDQAAPGKEWDPTWKSAVNYWFRHTWEYWWPLFPVVIVTLSIFDLEIWRFILLQLPLSLASLLIGYWLLIRPHLAHLALTESLPPAPLRSTWRVASPLVVVILCTLLLPDALGWVFPATTLQTRKLLALITGLLIGLMPIILPGGRAAWVLFAKRLRDPKALDLLGTIAGVILFKNLMEQSGLIPVAGEQLIGNGIPVVWIVALLPFVAGFVTGIAIGFAGIAFPLLAGLAGSTGIETSPTTLLFLGFACGYAGMMLSPVHLCFILSRGYFGAPLNKMYRYILPCTAATLLVAGVIYGVRISLGV